MREAALLALFERDRFAYHQWIYVQVETLALRIWGRSREKHARERAAERASQLVAGERLLERYQERAGDGHPEETFAQFVQEEARPALELSFMDACRQDENLLVLRTQEIARQEVQRLYRNRRALPGSSDEDLLHEAIQYVLLRLSWGRRVLESFSGKRGMNFSSYLRACVRHAAIDRVRTQVGRTTLWDEVSSLDDLSGDEEGSWEQWLMPTHREVPPQDALGALLEQEEAGRVSSVWSTLAQLAREDGNLERARVVEAWLERGMEEGDLPSIQDLARELGLPRGTVSSHLFRFRKQVAQRMPRGFESDLETGRGPPEPDG